MKGGSVGERGRRKDKRRLDEDERQGTRGREGERMKARKRGWAGGARGWVCREDVRRRAHEGGRARERGG